MTPRSLVLSVRVLLSFFSTAWCSPMCNNRRCRFVEGFPVRLKKLREDSSQITDYNVNNLPMTPLIEIAGDTEIGVKFLDKSLMKDVQEGQTRCFLRLVLRFYIERVFISTRPKVLSASVEIYIKAGSGQNGQMPQRPKPSGSQKFPRVIALSAVGGGSKVAHHQIFALSPLTG